MLIFTLGALMLSLFLAFVTYGFARSSVVQQREQAALDAAEQNAVTANNAARQQRHRRQVGDRAAAGAGCRAAAHLVRQRVHRRLPAASTTTALPQELVDRVIGDGVASYMRVEVERRAVHRRRHPAARRDAAYFEFFSLDEVSDTLQGFRPVAAARHRDHHGARRARAGSSPPGAPCAPWASPRRPRRRSPAAGSTPGSNPPTTPTCRCSPTRSTTWPSALQTRIERDARFASDVSHELRSPLMTLSASVEVMDARRDEHARAGAGRARPAEERRRALPGSRRGPARDQPLRRRRRPAPHGGAAGRRVRAQRDRRQQPAERADHRARRAARWCSSTATGAASPVSSPTSSTTRASTAAASPEVSIAEVEPDGPADPPHPHRRRGPRARASPRTSGRWCSSGSPAAAWPGAAAGNDGAGLGLSLVDEHVRMHGGRVWVEDRLDGEPGARFVIELPAEELDE